MWNTRFPSLGNYFDGQVSNQIVERIGFEESVDVEFRLQLLYAKNDWR